LNPDPTHIPEYNGLDLNGVTDYLRTIKSTHVLYAVLIAMIGKLSQYQDPQEVALLAAQTATCSVKGHGPYNTATRICRDGIGPKYPSFSERLGSFVNMDKNENDTEVYKAAMNAARDIDNLINRDASEVKQLDLALFRYDRGSKQSHREAFASPQDADAHRERMLQLKQDIASREKERDKLMTEATNAEEKSRR
jgi:hypothetical protein